MNGQRFIAVITKPAWALGLIALVLAGSLRVAPSVHRQGRDSGTFAYVGQVIQAGGLPYRDAWDNKPPGIYYLDALAFDLFGTDRWALWWIEIISLSGAALLLVWLLGQVFASRGISVGGTVLFVLLARHPNLITDTNFTETHALLPQMACFALGWRFIRCPNRWDALGIGAAAAVVFLFKQTSVGVALAFIPALVLARRPAVRWIGWMVLGGGAVLGIAALVLAAQGILGLALDAAFVEPWAWHHWATMDSPTLLDSITRIGQSAAPGVFGPWVPLCVLALIAAWRGVFGSRAVLVGWAALTLACDLFLSNITSRSFEHYYITPIPALAILAAFGLAALSRRGLVVWWIAAGITGAVLFAATLVALPRLDRPTHTHWLTDYVLDHTAPGDTVWVWGSSAVANFQSGRRSPTRFHYSYPLVIPGYTTAEMVAGVVADLETRRPTLIIDSSIDNSWVPPLDPDRRAAWIASYPRDDLPPLDPVVAFVADHCDLTEVQRRVYFYRCAY